MWHAGIRYAYSDVNHISTQDFSLLKNDEVVVLDVRSKEEYKVSRLRHAIHIEPDLSAEQVYQVINDDIIFEKTVVCYCSIGVRSSIMTRRLQNAGHVVDIYNLDGSIFKWANENRPIFDSDGQKTLVVHPYGAPWKYLLNKSKRF